MKVMGKYTATDNSKIREGKSRNRFCLVSHVEG